MNAFRTILTGLLCTSATLTATTASALPDGWSDTLPAWTTTASACSADEGSAGRYEFAGAQFRFLGNNTSLTSTPISNARLAVEPSAIIVNPIPLPLAFPITVRCNVTPVYDYVPAKTIPQTSPDDFITEIAAAWVPAKWNALVIGYKDPDGIGTDAQVVAQLKRLNRLNLVENTVATFNSNKKTSVVQTEDLVQFNHAFDFQKFEYYVEFNLYRNNTTMVTPVAYSARLTYGNIAPIIH
jgi:hypothetical protein